MLHTCFLAQIIFSPRVESTTMICVKRNMCLSSIAEWTDLRSIPWKCLRCWELFCLEHGIQPDGQMPSETRCQKHTNFHEDSKTNLQSLDYDRDDRHMGCYSCYNIYIYIYIISNFLWVNWLTFMKQRLGQDDWWRWWCVQHVPWRQMSPLRIFMLAWTHDTGRTRSYSTLFLVTKQTCIHIYNYIYAYKFGYSLCINKASWSWRNIKTHPVIGETLFFDE